MKNTTHPNKGFTLLEITIVLVLIGVVTAGGLVVFGASLQKSQADATVAKMTAIEKALLNYRVAFGRIPCPARLQVLPPNPGDTAPFYYGIEAGTPGACNSAPVADNISLSGIAEGAIPTRALQLPDDYMYDGWGRHMRYAVDITMTAVGAFTAYPLKPSSLQLSGPQTCPHGGITIYDSTGAARTANAIYALISHGANGHGAYTQKAVVVNAGSSNTNELINCHCSTISGASTGYPSILTPLAVTYVQQIPGYLAGNPSIAQGYFDDIVTFKERFQLVTPNEPSQAPTCP